MSLYNSAMFQRLPRVEQNVSRCFNEGNGYADTIAD